jgi:ribosome maturation factor RimP
VQVDTPDATLLARVEATDEHGVTMRSDGVQHTLAWSQLGTGRVQVEFNRPGEPDEPDDSSQDG